MNNYTETRTSALKKAKRIVVKVGSAVLTTDKGLDLPTVDWLAGQLSALQDRGLDVILVSSGAMAAGRRRILSTHASRHDFDFTDLPGRQATSAIGQGRLMHEYDEAFAHFGKVSAQILLTRSGLKERERFLNARNTLERLLSWQVIPIINENDTVSVKEIKFGDNDTLAALTVGLTGADLFVNLTSAGGVFDRNPQKFPDAKLLTHIKNISALDIEAMCDGKTSVGSGGMYSKLLAARRAAQLGAPTLILPGEKSLSLEEVFDGKAQGTWIEPERKKVSSRKFWLAYHVAPSGTINLDAGAAKAVVSRGKSLLPAGISGINGEFERGALVNIAAPDGACLGVGLTNYSASDLKKIMGRKTSEIEGILGDATHSEAIHRDNMLLDAAV